MLKVALGYAALVGIMVASTIIFKNIIIYSFIDTPILIIVGILGSILFLISSIINVVKVTKSRRKTA